MAYGNATLLNVKDVVVAGLNIASLQTPDGTNGNKFPVDGRTILRVKNTGGGACTVTLETPGSVQGLAIADPTVVVAATTGDVLIDLNPGVFRQPPGMTEVFVSFSTVTGVTVDVYRIPVN